MIDKDFGKKLLETFGLLSRNFDRMKEASEESGAFVRLIQEQLNSTIISSQLKCPHCKKELIIPEVAHKNIENYGLNHITIRCKQCRKKVSIWGQRKVEFSNPQKSNHNLSFGETS